MYFLRIAKEGENHKQSNLGKDREIGSYWQVVRENER